MELGLERMDAVEDFVPPEEELRLFRGVVKSLMRDASKVLAEIMLQSRGTRLEQSASLLDSYIGYTLRFCENDNWNPVE
jgi:hypothetical protein